MQKTLNLVNAPAGRRLTARLIDQVIPVVAGATVHVGGRSFTVPAA